MAEKKTAKKAVKKTAAKKKSPIETLEAALKEVRKAGYDVVCRVDRVTDEGTSEGQYL